MPISSPPDSLIRKSASSGEFTGRHMLGIMITFFGTVILVNATLTYFALNSWTGLVVPNSYVASQTFNKDTANRTEALASGATAAVTVERGYLLLQFAGKQKEAVAAQNLFAKLRHPVDGRQEVTIEFTNAGAGHYKSVSPLPAGTWVGDVKGEIKGYGQWAEALRFVVGD